MPLPTPLCPYCDSAAKLVPGNEIYPRRTDLASKRFWQCAPCDAYVGTNERSDNKPLGTLANASLRAARKQAHAAFDPVWKTGAVSRSGAYAALAMQLGINVESCHIAMFDMELCQKVTELFNKVAGSSPARRTR